MITDSFGRIHDYLRISLTDNCNFRCFYCMPDEDYDFTPASRLMKPNEILALAETFVANGVKKIRLTGGEPLVRKDAAEIITALAKLPIELVITTNGVRIGELLPTLLAAGIKSINISLDTLQPEKFLLVTRRDAFHQVKGNIELLLQHKIEVKINMVVMKDFNDNEITDFINWTKHNPIQVRFIEFMPFTGNKWTSNKLFPLTEILAKIEQDFMVFPVKGKLNDTAKNYMIPGHKGSFAIISTMTAHFCRTCNRMRLTADGKLKNCLFSSSETDLLKALRNGDEILPLIKSTMWNKKEQLGGQLVTDFNKVDTSAMNNRSMITIGG